MRKSLLLTALALILLPLCSMAETQAERQQRPHELRLTLGDCLWETLMWHNDAHGIYTGAGTATTLFKEKNHYFYTPHIGLEYHYRCNHWLSVGLMADIQATSWRSEYYNNMDQLVRSDAENFYNLSLMPTIRFTYFWHPNVNLYSSLGLGLDINGGTETDIYGKHTAYGAAIEMTLLGLAAGQGPWMGTIEIGGLSAMKNKGTIFMLDSRILALGVSYTF